MIAPVKESLSGSRILDSLLGPLSTSPRFSQKAEPESMYFICAIYFTVDFRKKSESWSNRE
jgi:hypothetical protein